jgi:hypothetical protein
MHLTKDAVLQDQLQELRRTPSTVSFKLGVRWVTNYVVWFNENAECHSLIARWKWMHRPYRQRTSGFAIFAKIEWLASAIERSRVWSLAFFLWPIFL